jgi:hypothetical protein
MIWLNSGARLLSPHDEILRQVVSRAVQPTPICCLLKSTLSIRVQWNACLNWEADGYRGS